MAFTPSQEEALKILEKNTIVSAGAGSGKTAVLTERIKRIIASGVSPLNILVLTFTKNAAAEMKARVKKALLHDPNLSDKANLVEQADISTIDAFTMSICKKYFNYLNIRPNVNIIDDNVLTLKNKEIMDDIFESLYAKKDEAFLEYLTEFTSKDDTNVKENLFNIIRKIDLLNDAKSFLDNAYEKYTSDDFKEKLKNDILSLLKEKAMDVSHRMTKLYGITPDPKTQESCKEYIEKLKELSSFESFKEFISKYKMPAAQKGKDDKDPQVEELRNSLAKAKNKALTFIDVLTQKANSLDELVEKYSVKKEYTLLYINILKEFFRRIDEFKDYNNAYTFNDLAKKALYLVNHNPTVRKELQDKYKYILIDEYQDTSDFQEGLLYAISNNNMYMVGDIKQSIYRFRNANPNLFKSKYDTFEKRYTTEDSTFKPLVDDKDGYRIDMIKNFRSRSEVLEDINTIFDPIMTLDYGDANYQESHRMVYGQKDYDKYPFDVDHHMDILTYDIPETDDDGNKIKYPFTNAEIEAFIVVKDIKQKINDNYLVYDKDSKSDRLAKYSDFCILIDREQSYDIYRKVFDYFHIPMSINQDINMTNDDTTLILTNILNLISLSNLTDVFKSTDYIHSFMSIARSYLYRLSDDEIFKIIRNKNEDNEITIYGKQLASLIDNYSNSDIYLKALDKFNFFKKLSTTKDIVNKEHEAEYVNNTILSLDSLGYSFKDIASYFKETIEAEQKIKYKLDHSSENGVKLMNIHKSKGLEFPVCYFTGLASSPNTSDETSAVFDYEYGFLNPKIEEGTKDKDKISSVNSLLTANKLSKLRKSERLRLFYVALTRTREKMILVCPSFKENKIVSKSDCESFLDYLAYDYNQSLEDPNIKSISLYIKPIDLDSLNLTSDYDGAKKNKLDIKYTKAPIYTNYDMPMNVSKSRISKSVTKLQTLEELKYMDKGTLYHEAMEAIDFTNPSADLLNVADDVKDVVRNVLTNDLFKNIKEAKTYHELEFSFEHDGIHYDGIIDLLVVYNDHIDIIDYKLSNTDSPEYKRQLSIYKEFVRTKTNLTINCYLLSLIKNGAKKVDC